MRYAQKSRGYVTLAMPPFRTILRGYVQTAPETCVLSLKVEFEILAILEPLTFNAQKFRGYVILMTLHAHTFFEKV